MSSLQLVTTVATTGWLASGWSGEGSTGSAYSIDLLCDFGICVDLGSRNMSQFDGMNCNLLGSWGLDCKASIDSWALAEFSRRTLSRQGWASSRAGWSENVAYGVVDKVRYYTSFPVWIYQAPIFCVQTTIIFSGLVVNAYSSTGY